MDTPSKQYDLEDPADPSWLKHRKHLFILSSAGKPIFSRYGDESKLAPLAGVLQALISFVRESGDHIRHVVAGAHRVVFVTRGSLYLVAVSSSGESVPHLARQLHCLHAQIISILTSKVEAIFQRNASFDLRGLLGGTDRVLRSLIREGSGQPTMLLGATPCLRMPAPTRAELGRLLAATRPTSLLFGVLLARGFLVQLWRTKKTPLHPQVRGGARAGRRRTGRSSPSPSSRSEPRARLGSWLQPSAVPSAVPSAQAAPPHLRPGPGHNGAEHIQDPATPEWLPALSRRPDPAPGPGPGHTGPADRDEHGQLERLLPRGRELAAPLPAPLQRSRDALRARGRSPSP